MVQVQELEGCIASLQDQLEQNERAHAIRVNSLQQRIAQADDQAETVNRMRHDELQLKVRVVAANFVLSVGFVPCAVQGLQPFSTGSHLSWFRR